VLSGLIGALYGVILVFGGGRSTRSLRGRLWSGRRAGLGDYCARTCLALALVPTLGYPRCLFYGLVCLRMDCFSRSASEMSSAIYRTSQISCVPRRIIASSACLVGRKFPPPFTYSCFRPSWLWVRPQSKYGHPIWWLMFPSRSWSRSVREVSDRNLPYPLLSFSAYSVYRHLTTIITHRCAISHTLRSPNILCGRQPSSRWNFWSFVCRFIAFEFATRQMLFLSAIHTFVWWAVSPQPLCL